MSEALSESGALEPAARPYAGALWRSVEAQHLISTMKLSDDLAEQRILEDIVERVKPPLPAASPQLHFLLATPFRYKPSRFGSRFRRQGDPRGVFYAAESHRVALAERAFYKLLDLAESIGASAPSWTGQSTVFQVEVAAGRALDLTAAPFAADRALWTRPADYAPCWDLAERARSAGISLIRYESVRDAERGAAVALFDRTAFARAEPVAMRTWHLHASHRSVRMTEDVTRAGLEFPRSQFAGDPRLAPLAHFD